MSDFLVETEENSQRGKEILEKLAKTGEFVFHGSPHKLTKLEPRQQTNVNKETGKSEPDGEPAVCATSNCEIAIFRALTSSQIAKDHGVKNYYTEFGIRDGKPYFRGNKESIDLARRPDGIGHVYVFSNKDFQPHDDLESRAYHEVAPIYSIEVKATDLPENIEITSNEENERITPAFSWEQIRAMQLTTPYSETLKAFFERSKKWRAQPRQPVAEDEWKKAIKQQIAQANDMVLNYHNPDLKMTQPGKIFAQGLNRPEIGKHILTRLYLSIDPRHSADAFKALIEEFSKVGCMRDIDIAFHDETIAEGKIASNMLIIYEPQSRPEVLNKILSAYRSAKEQHPEVFNLTPRQREATLRSTLTQFKASIDANLSFVEMDPEDVGKSWDVDEVNQIQKSTGINYFPTPDRTILTDDAWLKKQQDSENKVIWTKKSEDAITTGKVNPGDQLEYKRKLSAPALIQKGTVTAR